MEPKTAFEFLEPHIDAYSDNQKEKLCRLIMGAPKSEKEVKSKKFDPVMSKAQMKRLLMKNHFKSRAYSAR